MAADPSSIMDKTSLRTSVPAAQVNSLQPSLSTQRIAVGGHLTRSVSLTHRPQSQSENLQHRSLTRVKKQIAMNTPPFGSSEISWLRDQSPKSASSASTACNRRDSVAASFVNPTSSFLQDLIKEERASRGSRARLFDGLAGVSPRTPPSSHSYEDSSSDKPRNVDRALSTGLKQPREMGVREMDQYISKINKLNFDLKLEIFHRQQQMAALEAKIARMHELEAELKRMHGLENELEELRDVEGDNQRLRESNERLHKEIDIRDQAITEAVALIFRLEAQVRELGGGPSKHATPRDDQPVGDPSTPRAQIATDIPERTSSKRGTSLGQSLRSAEGRRLQKAPSFLCEENKDAATLLSLYTPGYNSSHTALSADTKTESVHSTGEPTEANSPRLSALSECSELFSGNNWTRDAGLDELNIPVRSQSLSEDSSESFDGVQGRLSTCAAMDRWMQVGRGSLRTKKEKYHGQESLLENPNTMLNHDGHTRLSIGPKPKAYTRPSRADITVYGGARLPPTPDTMSTAYIANSSNVSITPDKKSSITNASVASNKPWRSRSADQLTMRPNSADSLETRRRDTTRFQQSLNGEEDPFVIFPFSGGSVKAHQLLGPGNPSNSDSRLRDDVRDVRLGGVAIPNEKNTFLQCQATPFKLVSTSLPLTPQDWIDAAKSDPPLDSDSPCAMKNTLRPSDQGTNEGSDVCIRAQTKTLVRSRRHSLSSNAAESAHPPLPSFRRTVTETAQYLQYSDQKHHFSLKPLLFGRSSTSSRHLQPSSLPLLIDEDCAPPPIIPKTRGLNVTKLPARTHTGGHKKPSSLTLPPFHTESAREITSVYSQFSQSFTQPSLSAPSNAVRPGTSGSVGTDHQRRRRSSLGIFAWIKGGSAHNSSGKRSEPTTPTTRVGVPTVDSERSRQTTPSQLTFEPRSTLAPNMVNGPYEDGMDKDARLDRMAVEEEVGRKPRYVQRRSRA